MPQNRFGNLRAVLLVRLGLVLIFADQPTSPLFAQTSSNQLQPAKPFIAPASNEGEMAIKLFQVPPGLKIDLWAAEPMLANPVAFNFDEKGRAYVCETFRLHSGVDDIRGIMDWLDEELACRTVDDRLAEMKRHLGQRFETYTDKSERIRLLEDRARAGKADRATIFADGFNTPLDGIGAGVLARQGNVWYANIPNLWLLRDTNNDGVTDIRTSLHYGFGVRVGFLGHDLHGVHFGPDGKLYFSIGDRGSNVKLVDGRTVGNPDTGCVFSCNPDGSNLEVFAFGLRNPQDLVFDQYGNLFTGDNNSDSGDQARWVYLVEGGDSGWRVGYQFMENPYSRGPFNAERLWYPHFPGQAAYIVPPITNIASGPSGVAYFPGTGLPARFQEHFFLVDFRGAGANSGIHTFTLKPKGAYFDLLQPEHFIWGVLATDVKFGVDGGAYLTDWVQGWELTGKGRIYRVHDPASDRDPLVLETRKILAEGMKSRSFKDLTGLLAHPDIRIRQEAQFELADRGTAAIDPLAGVARKSSHQLARLHAIWGLGQILAKFPNLHTGLSPSPPQDERAGERPQNVLLKLLADSDPEVRAQSAKVLGEQRLLEAYSGLLPLLRDAAPRVRFFAALALGKLGRREALPAVFDLLRENNDRDPYLRHGGVMALTWIADVDGLLAATRDKSLSVRMGVLLAMRRLHRAELTIFLKDPEPALVLEAARAINDEPINGGMSDLAALIGASVVSASAHGAPAARDEDFNFPLLRRVLNANFHLGTTESANALASFAARADATETMRVEALEELADWPHPSGRDRVVGLWRPVAAVRPAEMAVHALQPSLASILKTSPADIRVAALHAAENLAIPEIGPLLSDLIADQSLPGEVRAAALKTMAALNDARLESALKTAQADANEAVRRAATLLQGKINSPQAVTALAATLDTGTISDKQAALTVLSNLPGEAADAVLAHWLDNLLTGKLPNELRLDLLDAAAKRSAPILKEKLASYASAQPRDDPLSEFRPALFGGNAADGKRIFFDRPEAQCVRCHKINGEGGDVGPDLSHVRREKDREYLLESIVLPNRQIAPGFESVMVTLKNDETYAGVLKSEDADQLVLNSPDTGLLTIKKADIQTRRKALSPMPEGIGQILSKHDLRNLIEFLSTLK